MEATEPVVDLAARFSSSDATPTPWVEARTLLGEAIVNCKR